MPTSKITLRTMCPGVCPLGSDSLCYHVQSDHDPQVKYVVDLSAWHGAGACTCLNFQMKLQPFLKAHQVPTARYACKHLRRVHRYLAIEVAQKILNQRQKQADANRKEHGHAAHQY